MASVLEAPRSSDPLATSTLTPSERIRTALNFYDYADQDPVNGYDLSGLCWPGTCWAKHLLQHATQTIVSAGGVVAGAALIGLGAFTFFTCEEETEGLYSGACEKAAMVPVTAGYALASGGVYGLVKASQANKSDKNGGGSSSQSSSSGNNGFNDYGNGSSSTGNGSNNGGRGGGGGRVTYE